MQFACCPQSSGVPTRPCGPTRTSPSSGFPLRSRRGKNTTTSGNLSARAIRWSSVGPVARSIRPILNYSTNSLPGPIYFEMRQEGRTLSKSSAVKTHCEAMADPLNLKRDDALAHIQGTLVGPDQKTTFAVVTLTAAGISDRGRVVQLVRNGLEKYCHVPADRATSSRPNHGWSDRR